MRVCHLPRITLTAVVALFVLPSGVVLTSCAGRDDEPTAGPTQTTTETSTATETNPTTPTETTPPPPPLRTVRIVVENGAAKGGIVRRSVDKGDRVVLVVTSDLADEVHLHGYDRSRDIPAGRAIRIRFRATLPGRFEVELEERGIPIAELTVNP